MDEKQLDTLRCIEELEAALFEYLEKYGPSEKAKRAINRATTMKADFGNDFAE